MSPLLPPQALDLIIRFETGGRDYYERVYRSRPSWPGGRSGVTIGAGYDLGYETHFHDDWQPRLGLDAFNRLAQCQGKTGPLAQQALSSVRDITIPWDMALEVFQDRTLLQEIRNTLTAFPGASDKIPALAFGALVSLVFNRGPGIDHSDRRREMLAIRNRILTSPAGDPSLCPFIAAQLRSMRRLWTDDPASDGDLCDRREAEAQLVDQGAKPL